MDSSTCLHMQKSAPLQLPFFGVVWHDSPFLLHHCRVHEQQVCFPGSGDVECLCSCCAFSAVLSALGRCLPCKARRENVSHRVIVTNPPPPHTRPPFPSSTFFPSTTTTAAYQPCPPLHLSIHNQKAESLVFFASWTHDSTRDT